MIPFFDSFEVLPTRIMLVTEVRLFSALRLCFGCALLRSFGSTNLWPSHWERGYIASQPLHARVTPIKHSNSLVRASLWASSKSLSSSSPSIGLDRSLRSWSGTLLPGICLFWSFFSKCPWRLNCGYKLRLVHVCYGQILEWSVPLLRVCLAFHLKHLEQSLLGEWSVT